MTQPEFIYVFDVNNRCYPVRSSETGNPYIGSGPIWIKHWVRHRVTGETRLSWILDNGAKIPKKRPSRPHNTSPCYSFQEVQRKDWANSNRHKIGEAVSGWGFGALQPEQLSEVAKVVGYPSMPEFNGDEHG